MANGNHSMQTMLNTEEALEHYLTRAQRRPRQVWDDEEKKWIHFNYGPGCVPTS